MCHDLMINISSTFDAGIFVTKFATTRPNVNVSSWSSNYLPRSYVLINASDPNLEPGIFYITVYAPCLNSEQNSKMVDFKLTVFILPMKDNILDQSGEGTILPFEYRHFALCFNMYIEGGVEVDLKNDLQISAPDLFISPYLTPHVHTYSWKLAQADLRSILIHPEFVKNGYFHISVYGWCTPEQYLPPTCPWSCANVSKDCFAVTVNMNQYRCYENGECSYD